MSDYPGTGFDWTRAENALAAVVASVLGPTLPVLWGFVARQRLTQASQFPCVVFLFAEGDTAGGSSDVLSAAPEPVPPVGGELVNTTQQMWEPVQLQTHILCDGEHGRGYYSPIAMGIRFATGLRGQPAQDAMGAAGIALNGPIKVTVLPPDEQAPFYLPAAVVHLACNLTEQAPARLGYLTGSVMTGTINGAPIGSPVVFP